MSRENRTATSRLHRTAMRTLIGEIADGVWAPGDRLPREIDLVEQYEISRGVARECIRGLEERGLIAVKHGHGAYVTPETSWDTLDAEVLEALLRRPAGGPALTHYLECRRILEVEAAGLAAQRATDQAIVDLKAAFARMRTTAERARLSPAAEQHYLEADIDFHRQIAAATRNPPLARMTEPIHQALSAALGPLARPEHRLERGLPEHERILDAIVGREESAARTAMRRHLATIETYLREYLAPAPADVPATK